MKKTAKIYIINIGGSIRNIKAFSKAQISKRLNISIYRATCKFKSNQVTSFLL